MSVMAAQAPKSYGAFYPGPVRRRVAWGGLGALALAALLHLALFGLLSLAWRVPGTPPVASKPVEVSLVDEVALDQRAPKSVEPPAQSRAPEQAEPEDAPPPAPAEQAVPEPAPPRPKAEAAPPLRPAPKAPPTTPRPVAAKPDKPARTPAPAVKAAAPPTRAVAATRATGTSPSARNAKATGSLLDDDFRKGLTTTPSKSKAVVPPAAAMDGQAAADIGSAIRRQVQPCADRQVNPGPGASRIVVTIRLTLNRDGSLNGRPTIDDAHGGIDDENRRYVDAVDRNAIASFTGCAPLKGLPPELYDVPRGWKVFKLRYKLPG